MISATVMVVFAFVGAAIAIHRGRALTRSEYYVICFVVSVLFAYACDRSGDSPLGIANTARWVRSVFTAFVLTSVCIPMTGVGVISCESLFVCFCCASRMRQREASSWSRKRTRVVSAALKRAFDVVSATCALLALTPLFLLIAGAIKAESRGPVLFTQERIGYRGSRFLIFKFRSMHTGAARYQHSPKDARDPRITRVGRWLRRLSLDELPQLVNVLRGEMSLVGPRPEMPFIVRRYNASQKKRLNAVPGLTGLWQISPARRFPIHENLEYDLYYIVHRSLSLDLAILLRTFRAVANGIGAS